MDQFELPFPKTLTDVCLTLADVIDRLNADPALSARRRRDMVSALHTLGRLVDMPLAAMPATPPSLRQYFEQASPASGGFGKGHWRNIRSRSLAALRRAGVRTMARRTRQPLAPKWDDLRVLLPATKFRAGLSRFMSFCSAENISPDEVTSGTFDRFGLAIRNDSISPQPRQVYRTACLLWNKATVEIAGWPAVKVPIPSGTRRYALDWQDFPPAFQADVEAYLNRLGNQDPFADDYAPSVRPSTTALRRNQIRQIATGLVLSGVRVEQITALAFLVQPTNAESALRFFLNRAGGKKTVHLHQQAILLKTIARHWVKAPPEQIAALANFTRNLAVKRTGMTVKNRERLRQFDNLANVSALIRLGPRILNDGRRDDHGRRPDAQRFMLAFAVTLLLNAPMRISNLAGLDLDRHFVRIRAGGSVTTHIVVPAAEIKNDRDYELELRADTAKLFAIYCEDYRPRLADTDNRWLFPNGQGTRRHTIAFGKAISDFVFRETGIRMNVHLFRHLGAKLYLAEHPNDIETVRLLLGHRSSTTTLKAYADLRTSSAFQRYDDLIASLRKPAVASRQQKPRLRTGVSA